MSGHNFSPPNLLYHVRFTVYPVMPTTNIQDSQSDRAVLSRPSLVLVTWLLDSSLDGVTKTIGSRLAAALAACAQLSSLGKLSGLILFF